MPHKTTVNDGIRNTAYNPEPHAGILETDTTERFPAGDRSVVFPFAAATVFRAERTQPQTPVPLCVAVFRDPACTKNTRIKNPGVIFSTETVRNVSAND